jgi:hypothetical protein
MNRKNDPTARGRRNLRSIHADQQRWGDEGEEHVLDHVHEVEVSLGEIVDRIVGPDPQHDHPGKEQLLTPGRRDLSGAPRVPAARDHIRGHDRTEQEPDVDVGVPRGQRHPVTSGRP